MRPDCVEGMGQKKRGDICLHIYIYICISYIHVYI